MNGNATGTGPTAQPQTATPAATATTAAPDVLETITVRVGRIPGRINEIVLNGGRTVGTALEGAELNAEGGEVRLNGRIVTDPNTAVAQGDTVLVVRRIRGNN